MTRPTPTLHLEQQRFGERAAVADDAAARAALDAADAALLERLPPAMIAARVNDTLARDARRATAPRRLLLAMPVVAAAAAVVFVVVPKPVDDVVVTDAADVVRSKGLLPALEIARLQGGKTPPLSPGDVVGAGDLVQVRMRAADARYGVVVSLDGRGDVTRHFPDDDDTSLPTTTASLPFSFELDDAPVFERFVFVTSASPLDVDMVVAAVKALAKQPSPQTAPLDLPSGVRWSDFILRKR